MAEDPFEEMKKRIAVASGVYLLIALLAVLVSSYGKPFVDQILSVVALNSSALLSASLIIASSAALGYFLVFLNIHNLIDRVTFRTRRAVDKHIVTTITAEAAKTLGTPVAITDQDAMRVFYSFANKPDGEWPVLRKYAFSLWQPYHIAMNWLGLSAVGLFFAALAGIRRELDYYSGIPVALFSAVLLLSILVSQFQLRPKLLASVPDSQLTKIVKDVRAEFDQLVRARFGSK